nr:MAG: putative membrane protein [Trout granulomatous virus]
MSVSQSIQKLSDQVGNFTANLSHQISFNASLELLDLIVWSILVINVFTFVLSLPYVGSFLKKFPFVTWVIPSLSMTLTVTTLLYSMAVGSSYMAMAAVVSAVSVAVSSACAVYYLAIMIFNLIRFRSFKVAYYGPNCYSINGTFFSSPRIPVSITLESNGITTCHDDTCLQLDPATAEIQCYAPYGPVHYSPVSRSGLPSKHNGRLTTIYTYTPVTKPTKFV